MEPWSNAWRGKTVGLPITGQTRNNRKPGSLVASQMPAPAEGALPYCGGDPLAAPSELLTAETLPNHFLKRLPGDIHS